jgi:hypothetical protein
MELFEAVCQKDLEGIMAKHRSAIRDEPADVVQSVESGLWSETRAETDVRVFSRPPRSQFKSSGEEVTAIGNVTANVTPTEVGIAFAEIDPSDRAILERWLRDGG